MSHDNISTIIRISFEQEKVSFGKITKTIDDYSGDHVGVTVIEQTKNGSTRDLTVKTEDEDHRDQIISRLRNQSVNVIDITDKTFQIHKDGKIEVRSKYDVENHEDLSQVYTPDVARVSKAIDSDPSEASNYTIKQNTIAIVTDGSALLGIGNVKPEAALPVMEGKAMLFKQMAGVNAYPICLETQDTEEIITTVKNIAPSFGGINMEDIAGPKCFEIEQRLEEELDIPVFHDDQHGTAVVLMAGFLNALKLVNKELEDCKVVLTGIGAAGLACSKMLLHAGVENLIGVDTEGALVEGEHYENDRWQWMAEHTNPNREGGELSDVIKDADVFIGVSAPNILGENDVKKMTDDAIVFAMANPTPEIAPETAKPHVRVMATGRSDYPNQINNVLCFPGLFRGLLDSGTTKVTDEMKMAAAKAIAGVVKDEDLSEDYIIPDVFDGEVVSEIRTALIKAAPEPSSGQRSGEDDQTRQ